MRAELANNSVLTQTEIEQMRAAMKDVEGGMSAVRRCGNFANYYNQSYKCDNMEGRVRRCNIQILGVAKGPGSTSTDSLYKLLSEVLDPDKTFLLTAHIGVLHHGIQMVNHSQL